MDSGIATWGSYALNGEHEAVESEVEGKTGLQVTTRTDARRVRRIGDARKIGFWGE